MTHDIVILDALAVIGDGYDSGALKTADTCHFLAFTVLCHSSARKHFDHALTFNVTADVFDCRRRIGDRRCIRHGYNAGKTSGGGSHCACTYRFAVGSAGLSEVYMNINETRCHDKT